MPPLLLSEEERERGEQKERTLPRGPRNLPHSRIAPLLFLQGLVFSFLRVVLWGASVNDECGARGSAAAAVIQAARELRVEMGSGGSKDATAVEDDGGAGPVAGDGCSGRSVGERRRWLRAGVLGSACFCLPSSAPAASDCEQHQKGGERLRSCASEDEPVIKSRRWTGGRCLRFRASKPGQATCSGSPCSGLDGSCQAQESASYGDPDDGTRASTQAAAITFTSNSSNHSCSCFGFVSDGTASRFDRAANLGSSGAQSVFPVACAIQNPEDDDHVNKGSSGPSDSRNGTGEDSVLADNSVPSLGITESNVDVAAGAIGSSYRNLLGTGNFERRPSRRLRPQEPLEGSVRFSRTRSVGRLRDRVLRGPSFSDRLFGPALGDGLVECHDDGIGRRAPYQVTGGVISSGTSTDVPSTSSSSQLTSMPSSVESSHDYASATPQLREVTNRDILEHRSAFVERRRRIRSQVRALQQLGNRVENFPGHDRLCILSGQHRTGHCPCRGNSRPSNIGEGRNARSSISRIVMLAEALFEVLDEIHQQAVVLASRPSVSSIGSAPAPKEAVERMPLRIYKKPQKHHNEEAAQCYICLVEYEEGDYVRILPCHHEFHRTCVDKWLKEIHRVCPLCRGDVCISDFPSVS